MVVVHRAYGWRFIIYIDDHEPAHVHVHSDGEAKVMLIGPDGDPTIVRVVGMTGADQRRMMREIREQRDMLLSRWSDSWPTLAKPNSTLLKNAAASRC